MTYVFPPVIKPDNPALVIAALKRARPHLKSAGGDIVYVCHAIKDSSTKDISTTVVEYIHETLQRKALVYCWLWRYQPKQYAQVHDFHHYRLAWVDHMIAELEKEL